MSLIVKTFHMVPAATSCLEVAWIGYAPLTVYHVSELPTKEYRITQLSITDVSIGYSKVKILCRNSTDSVRTCLSRSNIVTCCNSFAQFKVKVTEVCTMEKCWLLSPSTCRAPSAETWKGRLALGGHSRSYSDWTNQYLINHTPHCVCLVLSIIY